MFSKISAFFFFYFAIVGIYVIFMPKILSQLGYSPFEIGVIFSTAPLVRFLLPFIVRRYLALNLTVFYVALGMLVVFGWLFYFTIDSFWLFLLVNIPVGASMGIILPFIESYAMEHLRKERYGKARLFGSLGFILVSLVLAKVFQGAQEGIHFFMGSILCTVLVAFAIVHDNRSFEGAKKSSRNSLSLLKHRNFWIVLVLIQVSFGGLYNFFTIYESEQGVSLVMISFLWSFGVVCEIVFFYFQGSILKRIALDKLIKFATFMTSIRWLLLYLFPSSLAMTFFSQSFHAISFALLHSAGFLYLQAIYEDKKLSSQFYFGLTFGLGAFVGSLLAGVFYGEFIYLFCGAIAFLAFIYSRKIEPMEVL